MTDDQHTIQSLRLDVGDGYELYVQEWGSAAGTPIISLHGGPGGSAKDSHKSRFNPERHRVIFYDQRGCGQSTPLGSLEYNTTDEQVEDIIKILDRLQIDQVVVSGASWGSCLALVFAIRHPKRVSKLIINGIFTGTRDEVEYITHGMFRAHFPDVWQAFLDATPPEHHDAPARYHQERLFGDDEQASMQSGIALTNLEGSVMNLDDRTHPIDPEKYDPTHSLIEQHYMMNDCFLPEGYILEHAHKIKAPVVIIQGRYDFVCPPETAWKLHKALPNSQLLWTQAGHGGDRSNYETARAVFASI